ncbi:hypothetical protein F4819DRAFT_484186 [Hypoxylon fuscum]|nr:hypothetical protein F4819DRAFT_484186 [Hypoxylon fuscum]
MSQTWPKNRVIKAPSREPFGNRPISVFLAGITTRTEDGDLREALIECLADCPLTFIDPYRPDWDSSWREDITCAPFREQVEWELDMQEKADVVVVYFHPATDAPISLLELGLCASTNKKTIVMCPEGYKKRGNVQIVCERHQIEIVEKGIIFGTWYGPFDWV